MQRVKLQINDQKEYYCPSLVTQDEWRKYLDTLDSQGNGRKIDVLLMFYRQAGHKATCGAIGKEYGMSANGISTIIWNIGKQVQLYLGNKFSVEQADKEEDAYWPILMLGKDSSNGFEWTVRPELCAAIYDFLIAKVISRYKDIVISEGIDNSASKELYKWQIISQSQGRSTKEILEILLSTSCNLIEKAHMGATALQLLKTAPESICEVFDLLRADKPVKELLSDFNAAAKSLTPAKSTPFGDERTAAAFLACVNPEKFTPYTSTLYEDYCKYIGEKPMSAGKKYAHFLELLENIIPMEQADYELEQRLRAETEGYVWSDMLNAQDVLWQTIRYFNARMPKNWLQKMYDEAIDSEHWVYKDWYPEYENSVNLFLDMFGEGQTSESVSDKTKDYFIRVVDNKISSNANGVYSYEEYSKIIEKWPKIYSILSQCVAKGEVESEDYAALEAIITPLTTKNKSAAFHRLLAAVMPDSLTTVITDWRFRNVYSRIRSIDETLPPPEGNWLRDNITLMEYFKTKVTFKMPWHRALLAWYLHDELKTNENDSMMEKYTKLLLTNHNLILTGAPGTGKTHLAKQIAKAIGAEDNVKMVQFHPSYDYTDFVEGLRPCQDRDGFERVNGAFKEFCKNALSTIYTNSFDEAYEKLLADLVEREDPLSLQTPSGSSFAISANSKNSLNLHTGKELKINGTLTKSNIQAQLGGDNVFKWWSGYFKGVELLLKDKYELTLDQKKKGNYVFIIDEINRGELSKIFGELFFSIDPGYRGVKGIVETQYQNMVEPGDPFENGFYVPDNVYIIGTMNDIDRSVESMDFAIRRRFAWVEVTADSRTEMLDELIPEESEKARKSMTALNNAITDKRVGLSSAYHIGPAYYTKLANYDGDFESLWKYHIKGVLCEYLRGTKNNEEKIELLKEAFDKYKS